MKSRRIPKPALLAAIFTCLLCCGLAFSGAAFIPAAVAQKDQAAAHGPKSPAAANCSERTLRGAYEIDFSGHFVGVGPVATLGTITLDGDGNFTITDTASFNGAIIARAGTGVYNVESNCTGSATVTYTVGQPGRQATFNFVVTDQGRDVRLIGTTPGSIVSGSAKPL